MLALWFLIFGLIGLWLGATMVVESAKRIAVMLKVSQALIGLTVISIGTSLPEIATNIKSGLVKASGVAIGTNLGSDITQITFILGFTALLGTMYATKKLLKRDGLMVLSSIIIMFFIGITGYKVMWYEGVAIILIYLVYLYKVGKDEKVTKKITHEVVFLKNHKKSELNFVRNIFLMIAGIALLIYASDWVVSSALKLAAVWNVKESFIGVMIIGVGTGLPELSTAITAIFRKAGDISIGTLIGSNITDPMFSLGFGAIAAGTTGLIFEKNLLFFDIPFWFVASVIALLLFRRNMKIGKGDRKEGLILIGLYALFVFLKIKFFLH